MSKEFGANQLSRREVVMRCIRWSVLSVALVVATVFACRVAYVAGENEKDGETTEDAAKRQVYETISKDEEKGFHRKGPPKVGDWLFTYHEKAQSFEQYRAAVRVRPTSQRRTIVLQPLGEMNAEQKKMLDDLKDYAEAFFQLPTRIEKPLELKLETPGKELTRKVPIGLRRNGYDTQYNADVILDSILLKHVPADAVCVLGITMEDLYSGDMNYVFGLGSDQRVGVYSLVRYFPEFWNYKRPPDAELTALRRACKVLNHETGHMFCLPHCVFYDCSMNGSMSLQESDANPIYFCPVCQKKLLYCIGCDAEKRFRALSAFYTQHGMKEEAAFTDAQLESLRKANEMANARKVQDE